MRTREELAWCAGFFDGEGNVGTATGKRVQFSSLRIQIAQTDREVLDRIMKATGIGMIRGPYGNCLNGEMSRRKTDPTESFRKPLWWYNAHGEQAQAFVAMIWNWLGSRKRVQAREAMEVALGRRPRVVRRRRKSRDAETLETTNAVAV